MFATKWEKQQRNVIMKETEAHKSKACPWLALFSAENKANDWNRTRLILLSLYLPSRLCVCLCMCICVVCICVLPTSPLAMSSVLAEVWILFFACCDSLNVGILCYNCFANCPHCILNKHRERQTQSDRERQSDRATETERQRERDD